MAAVFQVSERLGHVVLAPDSKNSRPEPGAHMAHRVGAVIEHRSAEPHRGIRGKQSNGGYNQQIPRDPPGAVSRPSNAPVAGARGAA